ncbi:Transposase DDE domain group 1 [Quadrisphaera granulorum]|uniref:DDE family transposase n=1 Tax=Quadrisphaera granulorum TaxID=317664 RepID=A0A315ZCA8_9ACTN|nr:IS1380 family transposase [Quadrisphaera granulorum]PWJ42448.1 DDE family transposase [Quadrisphaera granulorum]SZE99227.1 Transposase DDE domain group 1 [Quadrisphaera granulorum]
MRFSHPTYAVDAAFDETNLLPDAGLVPLLALAERAGLHGLLDERLTVAGRKGVGHDAPAKIVSVIAGMAAGADCIEDLDVLRHGATADVFGGVKAPSTIGSHLRAYTFGHIRQLDAVSWRLLLGLHRCTGLLDALAATGAVTYVDVDDTVKEMHGYAQQGVAFGYSKVKGLNAQVATISTPPVAGVGGGAGHAGVAPVIAAARLRKGNATSSRGTGKIVGEAVAVAKAAGAHTIVVRADSAYYGFDLAAAAAKAKVKFSVTARMNASIRAAIAGIDEDAWTSIEYPQAIWDEDDQRWISDAEVAEVTYTAFTSRKKAEHVRGRLIVRRVKRLNPKTVSAGHRYEQGELFTLWRYHVIFTDVDGDTLEVEAAHRDHAIVEQVIADLKGGPMAHLPSGKFTANAAWLVCAVICHNLLRAAGHVAGGALVRARAATLRARLVAVPARVVRSGRRVRLRLAARWRWGAHWSRFAATAGLNASI